MSRIHGISEAKRLKTTKNENVKLKKILADHVFVTAASREILSKMVGPTAKRLSVVRLRNLIGLSERWARLMFRRCSHNHPICVKVSSRHKDAREVSRACQTHWIFGYRRLFILLQEEGSRSGMNRII